MPDPDPMEIDDGSLLEEILEEEGEQDEEGEEGLEGLARLADEGEEDEEGLQHQDPKGQKTGVLAEKPKSSGRLSKRLARLRSEAQEAKEYAQRVGRELQELRDSRQAQQNYIDPRIEAERRAAMTPEERSQEDLRISEQRHQADMERLRLQMIDTADRQKFETRAATDPRAKKYAADVEKLLGDVRRQLGWNPTRETLYAYMIGMKVLNMQPKKQRQQGQDNIRRQKTVVAKTKSDVSSEDRSVRTFEEKYGDVTF